MDARTSAHGRAHMDEREAGDTGGLRYAPWHALARRLGTPWHVLARARARARLGGVSMHVLGTRKVLKNLDLGVDPGQSTLGLILGCFLLEPRKRLNIYYKERCALSLGGMGRLAGTLEHALGAMPRHDPWTDHGVGHSSSRWDSVGPSPG
ncbi:hypothetical protein Syun_019318 [Stephania yunnanensis]|uniref:Uncharacterized protein n=1 Tax=Stephania yunnanensis TaxID=152371 RepID=A0AAP0ITW6_9MAGN